MSKAQILRPSGRADSSVSVRVEKISNGFLVHESRSSGDKYSSKTTYTDKKPAINLPAMKPAATNKRK